MAFKMKGPSLYKNSPMKQDKMAKMQSAKTGKIKKKMPFPGLKDHGDGTYSYDTLEGKSTLTKSEYISALELNKKHGPK
jgi:hypothetical protein|tara:strand:- start:503 stop:739 length:237 start_codon:yes stop_codon:yes gene_type:complete